MSHTIKITGSITVYGMGMITPTGWFWWSPATGSEGTIQVKVKA